MDAIHIGAGAVLATVILRTGVAIVLSLRGHERGESGWILGLQSLSDLILAAGAIVYANPVLRPDAPRVVLAALLVFAIAWEASVGASRIAALGTSPEQLAPGGVEGFLDGVQIVGWMLMTLMLVAFGAMVVMARPELTDAQKLAPIVGVAVPAVAGLLVFGFIHERDRERDPWRTGDTVAVLAGVAALAFACWVWL